MSSYATTATLVATLLVACSSTSSTSSSSSSSSSGGNGSTDCATLCSQLAPQCGIDVNQCTQQCSALTDTQKSCLQTAGCDQTAAAACLTASKDAGSATDAGDTCSKDPRGAAAYSCKCSDGSKISGCVLNSTTPCQSLCGTACGASASCTPG